MLVFRREQEVDCAGRVQGLYDVPPGSGTVHLNIVNIKIKVWEGRCQAARSAAVDDWK